PHRGEIAGRAQDSGAQRILRADGRRLRSRGLLFGNGTVCGDDSSRLAGMNVCPAERDPRFASESPDADTANGSVFQADPLPTLWGRITPFWRAFSAFCSGL